MKELRALNQNAMDDLLSVGVGVSDINPLDQLYSEQFKLGVKSAYDQINVWLESEESNSNDAVIVRIYRNITTTVTKVRKKYSKLLETQDDMETEKFIKMSGSLAGQVDHYCAVAHLVMNQASKSAAEKARPKTD